MSVFDKNDEGKSKVDLAVARIKNFCTGRKALVAFIIVLTTYMVLATVYTIVLFPNFGK